LQNRNLDIAIDLDAAHGCATLGILLNPASAEVASASISARVLFQLLRLVGPVVVQTSFQKKESSE